MKLCYNQGTYMKHSTLEKDLELCEKYGYDYIEIRLDMLQEYLMRNTMDDLKKFFATHNVKPYDICPVFISSFKPEDNYESVMDDHKYICNSCKELGINKTIACPPFDVGNLTKQEINDEMVKVINRLADYAEPFGVDVIFEFVAYPNCCVNTFSQAYNIVKAVNRDSVGMVIDCYHFHAMNSKMEDLKACDGSKIRILHINDAEDWPTGASRDEQRLWPGDGCVDLDGILSNLKQLGFDDAASIELFRPEYYEMNIEDVFRLSKEKTVEVLKRHYDM